MLKTNGGNKTVCNTYFRAYKKVVIKRCFHSLLVHDKKLKTKPSFTDMIYEDFLRQQRNLTFIGSVQSLWFY